MDVTLKLFQRGQEVAFQHGLILVDTKYEFGLDESGELTLVDEIHTPDSSRYWQAKTYEERIKGGLEPENFDKEFLRLWFKEQCDPYKDVIIPPAPPELVSELSRRYMQIFEQITGTSFKIETGNIEKRIENNLKKYII
ncbi:MAG: phosphoribosylaminoimidazolesuccinocarboxamide synthase [Patescibacteria group bacterium]